jgi:hypothetical protein
MPFRVDGIATDNREQADILADRLFNRYQQTHTVNIVEVFDDGSRALVGNRLATRLNPKADTETLDLFADDPIPLLTKVVK